RLTTASKQPGQSRSGFPLEAISLTEIVAWTGGQRSAGPNEAVVTHVSTDSRAIGDGDCFVALVGERFDGHAFTEEAVCKGANVVVFARGRYRAPAAETGVAYVAVEETKEAFQRIAREYRRKFDIPVVAIT